MSFRVRPGSRFSGPPEHAAGRKGASVLAMSAALSTALALEAPTASAQSVGVTSATVGGPLGKPPAEVERVLHVGVDVKASSAPSSRPALDLDRQLRPPRPSPSRRLATPSFLNLALEPDPASPLSGDQ